MVGYSNSKTFLNNISSSVNSQMKKWVYETFSSSPHEPATATADP